MKMFIVMVMMTALGFQAYTEREVAVEIGEVEMVETDCHYIYDDGNGFEQWICCDYEDGKLLYCEEN